MKASGIKQAGFSLVTTIFILVILVLLGSYMVTLVQIQNQSSATAIQSARADFIAYSGIEWAAKKALSDNACDNVDAQTIMLEGFAIALACAGPYAIDEDGSDYNVFKITATATYGNYGQADFVSRTTTATIKGGGG